MSLAIRLRENPIGGGGSSSNNVIVALVDTLAFEANPSVSQPDIEDLFKVAALSKKLTECYNLVAQKLENMKDSEDIPRRQAYYDSIHEILPKRQLFTRYSRELDTLGFGFLSSVYSEKLSI